MSAESGELVEIRFRVPRIWRDELQAAAFTQRISLADFMRMLVRQWQRGRYGEAGKVLQ